MRITLSLSLALLAWGLAMPAHAQKLDPEVQTLVDGNTDFGLTLYQRLAKKDGNLFFSPYSFVGRVVNPS